MPQEKWSRVEKLLRKLGVSRETMWRVKGARDYLVDISSTGMPSLPDFTLHNHNHSDNIILLLARLQSEFEFRLTEYEAYLLATSAYLHDLGMFFGEDRLRHEILPSPAQTLRACPQNRCDRIENYVLEGRKIGDQIRELHHLLSAFMLRNDSLAHNVIDPDDLPYLIAICRGHRKADLRGQGCRCYQNEPVGGDVVRMGLLAALLRLADALDFYADRAPKPVFAQRALSFLEAPVALEHWLKHYFVTDPYITRQDQGGNITMVCTVNFRVPVKSINGESYLSFFRPLFAKRVLELNEKDLDLNQYPSIFAEALHITTMQAAVVEGERDGFRDLPGEIARSIEKSGCKDILSFLEQRQSDIARVSIISPSAPSRLVEDNPFFHRGAIRDQSYFFGRERETREILRNVSKGECISIIGPWHIGKTSLLFHIADSRVCKKYGLMPEQCVMVYCTGQELRSDDQSNLCSYLLRKIQPRAVLEHPSVANADLDRSKLLGLLKGRLDLEEFRTLCFALQTRVRGLSYDVLPGDGLEAKVRELIAFLVRRDQLGLLPIELFKLRPDLVGEEANLFVANDRGADRDGSSLSLDTAYHELDGLVKRFTQRGFRTVLLLDEFELFAANPNTGKNFFDGLQALQAQHALTLVTSSRISLQELSKLEGSSLPDNFFLMFRPLNLGLFTPKEALSLITTLSQRAGITFSERTMEFILDTAGLHPFFLQVVCDHVFERQSDGVRLDDSGYESLRQEISSELEGHFRYYWETLDQAEQSVLAKLEASQTQSGRRQRLEQLARQGLVARKGQVYDYVSTGFREFVQRYQSAPYIELGSVRIVEEIGSGGMATVYKAYQSALKRYVAVKLLSRDARREGFQQRFQQEAQALAKLRHPNILSIYYFGQEEDRTYIVMDYVSGGTLADLINKGLPLKQAVDIAIQIGDALHCAHKQGIIHRDVKPANILIDTDGRPLLTDFGLVKFLAPSEQGSKSDTLVGTAAYMAPEQASGQADARSDIYALGTVLYEMVTGRVPFEAEDGITAIFAKLKEEPLPPSDLYTSLPAELERVILKAIELDPDDRYQSALEMIQDLQSIHLDA